MVQGREDLDFALQASAALGIGDAGIEEDVSATSRLSRVSRARNTWPMPPVPAGPTIS